MERASEMGARRGKSHSTVVEKGPDEGCYLQIRGVEFLLDPQFPRSD